MPFDGNGYGGRLPLIAPMFGHPQAAAVGNALAGSLAASYQHMRWSARLIGHTTYPQFLRSPRAYNDQSWGFFAASFVNVAEHPGVLIPFCATHILAQVTFRIGANGPTLTNAQVSITDGTDTDTGDAASLTFDQSGQIGRVPTHAFTNCSPDDPAVGTILCGVALADTRVTATTPEARTIVVSAHASGARMVPILVSTWWGSYG